MREIKVGDKVKFKTWNQMERQFGLDSCGNINFLFKFTHQMSRCFDINEIYTVKEIEDNIVLLEEISPSCIYHVTKDMLLFLGEKEGDENMRYQARDLEWFTASLEGKPALVTYDRVVIDSIPEGLHKYEIRHDDYGNPVSIGKGIWADFYGTILVKEPLELPDGKYLTIKERDNYEELGGKPMTLEDFQVSKLYKVEIKETLCRVVPCVSKTKEHALSEIKYRYRNEYIVLDSSDMCGKAEFKVM